MIHVQTQCITSKPLLFFKMNAHMLNWQLKSLSAALIELSQQYMVNAIQVHQTCVRNLPRTPAAFKKTKTKRSSEQRYLFQQTQAKGILLSLPIRGATRQKIKCCPQTRPLLSFPVISSFGTESQFFHWFKKKKQQCWEQQALALLAFTYQLLHYTLSQILTQLQKTKELLHLDTLELYGSTCFMYFQSAPSALCINISSDRTFIPTYCSVTCSHKQFSC